MPLCCESLPAPRLSERHRAEIQWTVTYDMPLTICCKPPVTWHTICRIS